MDIKYLTELNNCPSIVGKTGNYVKVLKPISMDEIISLEAAYNNGEPFPIVLRELLYIAGKYCYVLDYGINKTQVEMQETAKEWLTEENKQISKPFYAIEFFNGEFLFIYLDEGVDDPIVWQASVFMPDDDPSPWIHNLSTKLSDMLNLRLINRLSGY